MNRPRQSSPGPTGGASFATTHWSVVLAAGVGNSGRSAEAMEDLCQTYWYPLYAFVRRFGYRPHDAQDLTQSFFAHLLQSNLVDKARRDKGRFRSFLLASLRNFMATERQRAQARRRGGQNTHFSLDEKLAEGRYADEPRDEVDPARLYEKAWAITVLDQALKKLEEEYTASGKRQVFDRLQLFLLGERVSLTYGEVAADLGTSESAVKMLVQRLRYRYRECLRAVVANTVATSSEIDEELQHLVTVLGR